MRNTIRRLLKTQKLNLRLLRLLDLHKPPFWFFGNCSKERMDIDGSIVHVIKPKNTESNKVLFYIHGGAFISGPMNVHWHFLSKIIKRTGYTVIMVDYPKTPEHDHRIIQKSIQSVYKYFINEYDPENIVMAGDSAGGNLIITTTLWAKENNIPMVSKLIPLSPAVEMTMSNEEAWAITEIDPFLAIDGIATCGKWYINGANPLDTNFSPVYADLSGLPAMDIFCGTYDMLYPDGKKFAQKAAEAGVNVNYHEYPKMIHTWMFFPIPEAKRAFEEIVTALK